MKKINNWIKKNIITIIIIFLFMQPLLDIVTSYSKNVLLFSITPGIIIRMIFLLFLGYFYLLELKDKKDKKSLVYFIVCITYFIISTLLILIEKGINPILYEVQHIARTFYFPMLLVLVFEITKERNLKIKLLDFIKLLSVYLIFIIIPIITNTSTEAYTQGKTGSVGWFSSTNEISAILCILMPFVFQFIKGKHGKIIYKIALGLGYLFVLLMLGTKMTIIVLAALMGIELFILLKKLWKEKKYKMIIISGTILITILISSTIIIPKTNFYKNIKIHLDFLEVKSISDLLTIKNIDHFVFSQRLTFLKDTNEVYKKSTIKEKLLGIGYIENYGTDDVRMKTIEMDYFDIFYRHGVLGFVIFFAPFIYILRKNKIKDRIRTASLLIACIMALLTGHVLTSPSVSIILVMLIVKKGRDEDDYENSISNY